MTAVLPAVLTAVGLLCSGEAHASPGYTEALQKALGIDCPPRCTLCHEDNEGGLGTIRPASFGEVVVAVGDLEADDEARLRCTLLLLDPACEEPPECATEGQSCIAADTDADGMTDIEELKAGRNPNVPGEGVLCGAAFGCGAQVAPRSGSDGQRWPLYAAVMTLLGLYAAARRAECR